MNRWTLWLCLSLFILSCDTERCDCMNPSCYDVIRLDLKPEAGGYGLDDLDTLYLKSKLEGENDLYFDTLITFNDSFFTQIYCTQAWRVALPMKKKSNQNGKEKPVELYQLFVATDSFAVDQMRTEFVYREDECRCADYSLQSFRLDGAPFTIASNFGFVKLKKK